MAGLHFGTCVGGRGFGKEGCRTKKKCGDDIYESLRADQLCVRLGMSTFAHRQGREMRTFDEKEPQVRERESERP